MIRPAALAAMVLLVGTPLAGQDEITQRKEELNLLRDQIKTLETRIAEQQEEEVATLELLDSYDKKGTLLRAVLTRLRRQEKAIQRRIDSTRAQMEILESQLTSLKEQYARFIRAVYVAGRFKDLELLLTSGSVGQFYTRAEYLKRFSDQRRRDADRIKAKKNQIAEVEGQMQVELTEERRLIAEKGTEEDRLESLAGVRKNALQQIRKDRKAIQREMTRKLKAVRDLESLVERLVAVEKIRKEKEAEDIRKGILPVPVVVEGTFETRRGKLRWPVERGVLVARFGNQVHPTLRTVTQNTGVDIAVEPGSSVQAVADGEVSMITWLPSFGNVVIINHYNGYRTVSTHLSNILVTEGEKVKEGDSIGESGESLDGPRLHFEIWKDREKQNPETWLARK